MSQVVETPSLLTSANSMKELPMRKASLTMPFDDLAIQRGLRMVYHHRKIDRKLFEKYRRRFSPYCSVASLYLWVAAGGAVPGLKDYAPKKKAPAKKAAPAGSHTEKTSKV